MSSATPHSTPPAAPTAAPASNPVLQNKLKKLDSKAKTLMLDLHAATEKSTMKELFEKYSLLPKGDVEKYAFMRRNQMHAWNPKYSGKFFISERFEGMRSHIGNLISIWCNKALMVPQTEAGLTKAKALWKKLKAEIKKEMDKSSELILKEEYIENETAAKTKLALVDKLKEEYPDMAKIWDRPTLEFIFKDDIAKHDIIGAFHDEIYKQFNKSDAFLNAAPPLKKEGKNWVIDMDAVKNWSVFLKIYETIKAKFADYLKDFESKEAKEKEPFKNVTLEINYNQQNQTININVMADRPLTAKEKTKLKAWQGALWKIARNMNSRAVYDMDGLNFKNKKPENFWAHVFQREFKALFPGKYPVNIKGGQMLGVMKNPNHWTKYGIVSRASFDGGFAFNKRYADRRAKVAEKALKHDKKEIRRDGEFKSMVMGVLANGKFFECKSEADVTQSWKNLFALYKNARKNQLKGLPALKSLSQLKRLVNDYNKGRFNKYVDKNQQMVNKKANPELNMFFDKYLGANRNVEIIHQGSESNVKVNTEPITAIKVS